MQLSSNVLNIPTVINIVVNNNLCVGCGLCVYKCPTKAIEMGWDEFGFLIPKHTGICENSAECLIVCPFNPCPQDCIRTEYELEQLYITEATQFHEKIGKYNGIYVGYAEEYRLTSSSGGIATYLLQELLRKGIVDHVISVRESKKEGVYYEYAINSTREDLLSSSKTKYFPVTLSIVMSKIHQLKGQVAIIGVACFIKAIRLVQRTEPDLKDKIPFLVGIICGGIKSRFFTEYLAGKAGVSVENIKTPKYRIKDLNSTASDYAFCCHDDTDDKEKKIRMLSIGDMWGTGFFKANACDFCDDVTTELADISLGDAWLTPFINDGRGTNVIVTRSLLADNLIQEGMRTGKLYIEQMILEHFLASQKGSFNHRHRGLSVRLKNAKKRNLSIPPKRFGYEKVTIDFVLVQKLRMKIRQRSLNVWLKYSNAKFFDISMRKYLKCLNWLTRFYHYRGKNEE